MSTLIRLPLALAEFALRQTITIAEAGLKALDDLAGRADDAEQPDIAVDLEREAFPTPRTPPERAPGNLAVPRFRRDVRAHVDSELAEVASFGPAEAPGATVEVALPWDGYDGMPAPQIVERLRAADAATRAAVALYEQRGKGRRTVLAATR